MRVMRAEVVASTTIAKALWASDPGQALDH